MMLFSQKAPSVASAAPSEWPVTTTLHGSSSSSNSINEILTVLEKKFGLPSKRDMQWA
jgi:hypothetical protein